MSTGPQSPRVGPRGNPEPESKPPPGEYVRDVLMLRYTTVGNFAQNLISLRLGCAALIVAVVLAIPFILIGGPFAYLWIPIFVLVLWFGAASPGNVLYCPACRKRVKAGANACHHCGRQVA